MDLNSSMTLGSSRSRSKVAWLLVAGLVLSACGTTETKSPETETPTSSSSPDAGSFDPALVAAAEAAALDAAGGRTDLGGKVTFLGTTGGVEGERLKALFQPFTDATGIAVDYQGSSDLAAVLQTQVRAGTPPDLVQEGAIGVLRQYQASGDLVPLDSFLDMDQIEADFNSGVLDGLSVDGHLYGAPAAIHTMKVWYNKKLYDGPTDATFDDLIEWGKSEVAAGNPAPFCITLEQGGNSGYLGVYLLENVFLKTYGPDLFAQWANGTLPYTSPEVKETYEKVLSLFSENLVYGGVSTALSTPQVQAPTGLFTDPQNCQLLPWGSFTPSVISSQNTALVGGVDYDFFPLANSSSTFPTTEYAAGWVTFAFTETPQLQAFVKYYTSAAFQTLTASTGGWILGNNKIPSDAYPTEVQQRLSDELKSAEQIQFGPVLLGNLEVRQLILDSFMELVGDPSQLDAKLAQLDQVRSGA